MTRAALRVQTRGRNDPVASAKPAQSYAVVAPAASSSRQYFDAPSPVTSLTYALWADAVMVTADDFGVV